MKKHRILLLTIISAALSSCTLKKQDPAGTWFYTHATGTAPDGAGINAASFISLQPDGKYTRDFGVFEEGRWEFNDTSLVLRSSKGQRTVLPRKGYNGRELRLLNTDGTLINFERQPGKFSEEAENPFSAVNNKWRVPPLQKEDDVSIRARLRNHFRFYEVYLQWAINNGFNSLDLGGRPTLLEFYGNGFAIKKPENLPSSWCQCFYDQEDCEKASLLLKENFDKHDISWAHTDNRFKMFLSAFQQLQQQMK